MIAAGRQRRDPGLASIKRRLDSCFAWVKYSLVNCIKISGNETDLRKTPEEKFALRVGAPETSLTSIAYKGQKAYLNNRVFLSRNYRLIVAPRKFDVLKTHVEKNHVQLFSTLLDESRVSQCKI